MTTGLNNRVLLLIALLFTAPAQADALLNTIFQNLSQGKNSDVDYIEHKYMAFLDVPLAHSGRMRFEAPDTLIRSRTSPTEQTYTIRGNQVTIDKKGDIEQHALDKLPPLHAFIESLRAVILGDAERLQQHFEVEAKGAADNWTLVMTPRSKSLKKLISRVEFAGQGALVNTIHTYEIDGDWSEMRLTHNKADHEG